MMHRHGRGSKRPISRALRYLGNNTSMTDMVLHMLNFFGKKPESVLEDRLRSNPYFPFETALIESTGTTG